MGAREFVDEADEARKATGCEAIVHPGAAPLGRDQTGLAQQPQMVRDRRLGQVESGFDVTHAEGSVGASQEVDHLEACGIAERLERGCVFAEPFSVRARRRWAASGL